MIKVCTNHIQIDFDGQISISAEKKPTAAGWIFAIKIESLRNFTTPGRAIVSEQIDETGTKVYLTFRQTESIYVFMKMLKDLKKIMEKEL
jgi:hypothetical protein